MCLLAGLWVQTVAPSLCVCGYIHNVCTRVCVCWAGHVLYLPPPPLFKYLTQHFTFFSWECSGVFPTTLLEQTSWFVAVLRWTHVPGEFAGIFVGQGV